MQISAYFDNAEGRKRHLLMQHPDPVDSTLVLYINDRAHPDTPTPTLTVSEVKSRLQRALEQLEEQRSEDGSLDPAFYEEFHEIVEEITRSL